MLEDLVKTISIYLGWSKEVDMGSSSSYDLFVNNNWFQFIHLLTFAFWFGMLQWNTWFAGIIMFKNMPRHIFGNVQSKLFPWYFRLGLLCNAIVIYTFHVLNPETIPRFLDDPLNSWRKINTLQILVLVICFLCTLVNEVYVGPTSTEVMFERHKEEKNEIKNEAKLQALNSRFSMLHGISSLLNLIVMILTVIHLLYLEKKMH
eukprot:TRINITY_DN3599_c0_g1_i1.p1 TRINITY_DN3599_c0_g1~~TRINITY_DN3599_c0_g1_i1.p1  ORF type:complete len:204 (+),score=29.56 TRINITY_DN3599_c0_g1_i1:47-658(+)